MTWHKVAKDKMAVNVINSPSLGTVYHNTTDKPKLIIASVVIYSGDDGFGNLGADIDVYTGSSSPPTDNISTTSNVTMYTYYDYWTMNWLFVTSFTEMWETICFIVMPGEYYKLVQGSYPGSCYIVFMREHELG